MSAQTSASPPRRMLLNAFSMNCVSHIQHGLWRREDTAQFGYTSLDTWVDLARTLERGCFDGLFLADVVGLYDTYRGGPEVAIREGLQIPSNDPAMLVSAMAYATEHLGIAYTSSVLQTHPYMFARQLSTLDHLTRGRIGWNIVTSYLPGAARNLGFPDLPAHDARYDYADEYLDVLYKLWEGSWDEDAVLRDRARGIYADPAKVHTIDHHGQRFDVPGPHLCEPSPQRTPLLFQAGSSDRGRMFAARHAECMFVITSRNSLRSERSLVADVRRRLVACGREPDAIKFFQGLSPVVGGTEAEARAKEAEYREQISSEAALAHLSGSMGIDLAAIDPDQPLETVEAPGMQGIIKGLVDSAPRGTRTLRDIARAQLAGQFLAGTPEQIADILYDFWSAGIDGFNLVYSVTPGTFVDFIDGVVPVLQARGWMQREYRPGTVREKIFGTPRLPASHPAAAYRR